MLLLNFLFRSGINESFKSVAISIFDSSIYEATCWDQPQNDNAWSRRADWIVLNCCMVLGVSTVVSGFRVIHANVSLPLVLMITCLKRSSSTLLFRQPSSVSTCFEAVSFLIPPKQNSKPSQKDFQHYLQRSPCLYGADESRARVARLARLSYVDF